MPNLHRALRIAVLGAGGIGRAHIRILHSLGAKVVAVLGSTKQSAEEAVKKVSESCPHEVTPYWILDKLLEEDIDGVTIATPAKYHYEQISEIFKCGLPVFCEKPMFWDGDSTEAIIVDNLSKLRGKGQKCLLVNTSNTVFIDVVEAYLPAPHLVESFSFSFHTNGPFRKSDIAVDLLPHGLSLLLHFFGLRELKNFFWELSEYNCKCFFNYGECKVEFDFQEHPEAPKLLSFMFNDLGFERVQIGEGESYKVMLREQKNGKVHISPDPFEVYISRFLELCRNQKNDCQYSYQMAEANMKLMAQCIDLGQVG